MNVRRFWLVSLSLIPMWLLMCSGGQAPAGLAGDDVVQDVANDSEAQTKVDSLVTCTPGESCDDNDPCTVNDECSDEGVCKGKKVPACDDKLECTFDQCKSQDDCTHSLIHGWCMIGGKCYKEGDVSPDNPCMACITSVATDRFVPDSTHACEDGDECTKGDHCQQGKCISGPVNCDDGNPCTRDYCDGGECKHEPLNQGACSDGDFCTTGDHCVKGICKGGKPVSCDDRNPCTVDKCDPKQGCIYTPVEDAKESPGTPADFKCDDHNPCTVGDHCQQGKCVGNAKPCDDNDVCTDDFCVPSKGCVHVPNNAPCDDGDPCTVGDTCRADKCEPGPEPLICDDGNPCTTGSCVPKKGCVFTPVMDPSTPCEDGNLCTIGDHCQKGKGKCVPGNGLKTCPDYNPCTTDSCDPDTGECLHEQLPAGTPCSEHDPCTENGTCDANGKCVGQPVSCDDGNDCTIDDCDGKHNGCYHTTDTGNTECIPRVTIDFPARGATLSPADNGVNSSGHLVVTGKVKLPTAPTIKVTKFQINGQDVELRIDSSGDGGGGNNRSGSHVGASYKFTYPMDSKQGMNTIVVDYGDSSGVTRHLVQSYYYSKKYLPMYSLSSSRVNDGLMLYMGVKAWNKIADIAKTYLKNMDLNKMITNPIATEKVLNACEYGIYLTNLKFKKDRTQLTMTPYAGYLSTFMKVYDISGDITAKKVAGNIACPKQVKGTVSVEYISVFTRIHISISSSGTPQVTTNSTNVNVGTISINLGDSQAANALEKLINKLLQNKLKTMMKNQIIKLVNQKIGPMLKKILLALNMDKSFTVPTLLPGQPSVTVNIKTILSAFNFIGSGSVVKMNTELYTHKTDHLGHNVKGSITRSGCCNGHNDAISLPKLKKHLELGLHDDMINEIPYALYWGGALKLTLTQQQLNLDLSDYNIENLVLHIDFWLPPILTGCKNSNNKLKVEAGDIGIHATMTMMGMDIDVQAYASAAFDGSIGLTNDNGNKVFTINIGDITFLDLQVNDLNGNLAGGEDSIRSMVMDKVIPMLTDKIVGKSLGKIPIPEVDLHKIEPSVPAGTKLKLIPQKVDRFNAYTVVGGDIK